MAASWSEDFFSQFTPLMREGRAVRADDGLLVFVRATDGEYVRFHDSQIRMEDLDTYIRNDLITKASEVVSAAEQQFELPDTNTGQELNAPGNVLVHQQQPQQQQHLQMQVLTPHFQSLHSALQLQVSQHQQQNHHNTILQQQNQLQQLQQQHLQQQHKQASPQTLLAPQPHQLQNVQQQLQQQMHHQLQQQQQELLQQQQSVAHPELKSHVVDVDVQNIKTKEIPDPESTDQPELVPLCSTSASLTDSICSTGDIASSPHPLATSNNNKRESSVKSQVSSNFIVNSNLGNVKNSNNGAKSSGLQHHSSAGSSKLGQPSVDMVWMNIKTPEARMRDKQATQALIDIVTRQDTQAKLSTKTTKKKAVWQEIGKEMAQLGFVFENPGDKCSQKWRNIERTYKDYELSKKIPDLGPKRPPEFYNELSQVLKEKHAYSSMFSGEAEDESQNNQQLIKEYVDMETNVGEGDDSCVQSETTAFGALSTCLTSSTSTTVTNCDTGILHSKEESSSIADADLLMYSTLPSHSQPPSSSSQPHQQASYNDGLPSVLAAVQSQRKEMGRLESILSSVRDLLEEQKQERETMRVESRVRFAELKSLIENNQREKMKFMYDFLKTIQLTKGSSRRKGVSMRSESTSDK